MNSVPQISVSSTRVQRKCVGGGGGDGHFFSPRKAFWRKRHFNCPLKSKQRRAFRGLLGRNRGVGESTREGRRSFEERLADGYSDQKDSELLFPEESCSRELT